MPPSHPDQSSLIDERIQQLLQHTISIRKDLHAHPELAYNEHRTHDLIVRELTANAITHTPNLAGGTGVLAHLPPTTTPPSPTNQTHAIAFRADIDALPITEQTGLPHASQTPGLMHACGHDGHTATLLALAKLLNTLPHRPNPITFIFQPAEEGGAGAQKMCQDGALDGSKLGPPVSQIFGLHAWPDLTLGHVATKPGPLLAATDTFDITITGKQAHAAFPHVAKDPIVALAHVITALQTVVSRTISPLDSAVVTVGQLNAGTAVNIIPATAHAKGTLRTLKPETRDSIRQRITELAAGVAAGLDCTAKTTWKDGYPVTVNEPKTTQHFFSTAAQTLGQQHVQTIPEPFMGGEDFAFYAQLVPACFFVLGLTPPDQPLGSYPKLHTPHFDFNDNAITTALKTFAALALAPPPPPTT